MDVEFDVACVTSLRLAAQGGPQVPDGGVSGTRKMVLRRMVPKDTKTKFFVF